jgi:hypothetical protein
VRARLGAVHCRAYDPSQIAGKRVYITNYEALAKFDDYTFGGIVLDESSRIKSYDGKTTRKIIERFSKTPFRLACSATPAPNDHMELGQHSEFLGALSSAQMLTRFFIHDSADTGQWRMKGHSVQHFWEWVSSWARAASKPSDLGFSDEGYILPALNEYRHVIKIDTTEGQYTDKRGQGLLFRMPDISATSIHTEKRLSINDRADKVLDVVSRELNEPWVSWCDTDYEAEALMARFADAVEVSGAMTPKMKEDRLVAFSRGDIQHLVTKPSVAGWGLNWQHCARTAFAGLSFSYESYYQAVRRFYRFGQKRPVDVHIACADTELSIYETINRKAHSHETMKSEMIHAMRRAARIEQEVRTYEPLYVSELPAWLN